MNITNNQKNNWSCYFLLSDDGKRTYIGASNNVERRLRQHNGELKGGAKATRGGRPWKHICIINGFDKISALQFEWRCKKCKYSSVNKGDRILTHRGGPQKKIINLMKVFNLEKWTSNSVNASEIPLQLNWIDSSLRPADFNIPEFIKEGYLNK